MSVDRQHEKQDDLPSGRERRHNLELRERLDEIVKLARQLSRESKEMSQAELDEIRDRIEWLAEEIWASAAFGQLENRRR